jgi:hypothetical protein
LSLNGRTSQKPSAAISIANELARRAIGVFFVSLTQPDNAEAAKETMENPNLHSTPRIPVCLRAGEGLSFRSYAGAD